MRLNPLHRQPPAHSPLSLAAVIAAPLSAARSPLRLRSWLKTELMSRYRAGSVLLCGSGTQALQLAIAGRDPHTRGRPRIALPAYACFDLVSAAVGADALVAFYDVDPHTLAPDPDSLRRAVLAGVNAVVVAPLFGVPIDMAVVREAAGACTIIEDAAQGFGASWRGEPLGSHGDLAVLSFGRGKGWTGGHGGALIARQAGPWPPLPSQSSASSSRDVLVLVAQWTLGRPALFGLPAAIPGLAIGETVYKPPVLPRALSDLAIAVLRRTHAAALHEAQARRDNAARLLHDLAGTGLHLFTPPHDGVAGWLRLPVRVRGGITAFSDARRALRAGIAPSYPQVLPQLDAVRPRIIGETDAFPGAAQLVRELITLPTHSRVCIPDVRAALPRSLHVPASSMPAGEV